MTKWGDRDDESMIPPGSPDPLFRTPKRDDLEPHRIEWWFPLGLLVIVAIVIAVIAVST